MTDIKFNASLTESDPHLKPVLIVGQLRHLNLLKFSDVSAKLLPRVTEETFKYAISSLHPAPTDKCPLYLDLATIAATPLKSSRHNAPSRAHAITRLVKQHAVHVTEENIVIVCEREDIFASACAAVRAFPLYSRKTSIGNYKQSQGNEDVTPMQEDAARNVVNVEFVVIEANQVCTTPLNADELQCLQEAAHGVRLAARIVDTPCNEMYVDRFVQEIQFVAQKLDITPLIIRDEELEKRGFGGIYGVGKAAVSKPALVVLSHEPQGAKETLALVGKGIVYDTGGLSIKGKTAMPGMKRDCGGAAAILGAFYAAVKLGFKENLHAVFCLAENSVGPNATR